MTPEVPSAQAYFQTAIDTVQGLQQIWLGQSPTLPNSIHLDRMMRELDQIAIQSHRFGNPQPAQLCRQLLEILQQIRGKSIRRDTTLQTQVSEALGTLGIMIQALSVPEGPALSVLDRLGEGISGTLTQAEQHLHTLPSMTSPKPETDSSSPQDEADTVLEEPSPVTAEPDTFLLASDPPSTEALTAETTMSPAMESARANEHHDFLWLTGLIFVLALVMRLWNLGQFEAPVFDEVYFPVFAENYLDGESFYDVHPPLGKYLIALGILIFGRYEIGYRIMPALFGALIPVLVAGVAYRLTYWRNYALLAGALMLTDGLFLVESRYGLMNVFLVAFGFAAQIFMLTGLTRKGINQSILFTCSGLMLGAAIGVKFNGLFFCFLFIALMILAWGIKLFCPQHLNRLGVLARITQVRWWQYLFCFILPAFAFYAIIWIPHLMIIPVTTARLGELPDWIPGFLQAGIEVFRSPIEFLQGVVEINKSLIGGHTGSNLVVTDDTPVHPYCSTSVWPTVRDIPILRNLLPQRIWSAGAWSWPILGRPVGYYFSSEDGVWRAVHALGNPILWWLSILSVLGLSIRGLRQFWGVPAFLLLGFATNYLPWFSISRCVFIYHYMSALAFAIMAFAWVACCWLHDLNRRFRVWLGFTVVTLAIAGLIWFAPVWYGFPLQSNTFYWRMWFRPNEFPIFCFSPEQCQKAQIKIKPIQGLNWI